MAPPPFNIVVVVIWSVIRIINMMISGCTCGRCKLSLNAINPYYIGFLNRGSQHSDRSIVLRNNGILKSKDYSASQEKKEDREQLLSPQVSIDSMVDDVYCKYCYCRMKDITGGNIEDYFKLFQLGGENASLFLDTNDMLMIKKLFRYSSLCPQCYRPYAIWSDGTDRHTDRHDRHHALMEMISCYIFLLLMWIPLLLILSIPALFGHLYSRISESRSVWSTYCAYVMQLDDTEYQRDVNRIVEKGCGDNHAFDSDDDGDDNDEKVNTIHDPTYKLHTTKKKLTTTRLERKQRKKKRSQDMFIRKKKGEEVELTEMIDKSNSSAKNVRQAEQKRSKVVSFEEEPQQQHEQQDSDEPLLLVS
eukprot:919598_1